MVDYARWERDLADEKGNIRQEVVYVEVRKESDGLLATIYSGRTGGALANPFTVTDGIAGFHAAASPGGYQIRLYIGASLSPAWERTLRYVPLGLLAESDGTFPGVAYFTDGSAAAPSIAFANDTDTGLYRVGADSIGITTGGTARAQVDSNGARFLGYLRVGSLSAPSNTTAGDVTALRLMVGGNTAFSATYNIAGFTGTLTGTAGQAEVAVGFTPTLSPASASASSFRVLYLSNNVNAAQNFTSNSAMAGGYFENRVINAGTIGGMTGVTAFGLFATSSAASLGTVTSAVGVIATAVSSSSNALTATISAAHVFKANNAVNSGSGPLTITGQSGLTVESLTAGTNNVHVLLGAATIPSGNWGIYASTTYRNYMAGGLSLGSGVVGTDPGAGGIVGSSNATFAAFIPSGSTVPTNGMYLSAANRVAIASNSTAVFYVDNSVGFGLGGLNSDSLFTLSKTFPTGAGSTVYGLRFLSTIPSVATSSVLIFQSIPSSEAAAFTLGSLVHYSAQWNVTGAGSAITNQYGFSASSSLTQASNNYGFYGAIAAAANRWNVYMAGTARNYMAGALSIGATTDPGSGGLYVNGPVITGSTVAPGNAANFYLGASGSNGVINWDANDYTTYDKATNALQYYVGAAAAFHITANGFGYPTGAGGTVTQATSKSTAVTLNKTTGAITTHNAALAADTIVSFVLNNSAIAATDLIVATHESGGTLGAYTVNARATGAGTAAIDIRNNTAGSLSEALEIRFAVIKSVDS